MGAGEMAQRRRAHAALPEATIPFYSPTLTEGGTQPPIAPVPGDPMPCFHLHKNQNSCTYTLLETNLENIEF